MRHAQHLLAALFLVFGLILCADHFHPARAQTPPVQPNPPAPLYINAASQMTSDHSGKDVAGKTEALKDCRLVVTAADVTDLNQYGPAEQEKRIVKGVVLPYGTGPNLLTLVALVPGLPDGTYQGWIAARDQAGNVSKWTRGDGTVTTDQTPPEAPTNLKIRVVDGQATIEINGQEVRVSATGKLAKN